MYLSYDYACIYYKIIQNQELHPAKNISTIFRNNKKKQALHAILPEFQALTGSSASKDPKDVFGGWTNGLLYSKHRQFLWEKKRSNMCFCLVLLEFSDIDIYSMKHGIWTGTLITRYVWYNRCIIYAKEGVSHVSISLFQHHTYIIYRVYTYINVI